MGKCAKCQNFLGPGYFSEEGTDKLCDFCLEDKTILSRAGKNIIKSDAVREYDIYIKKIKEMNEGIKKNKGIVMP